MKPIEVLLFILWKIKLIVLIDLKIPLPFNNYDIQDALKIKEIDILYKESDGIAVRVVETLPVDKITNQSCVCEVDGAQTPGAAGNPIAIKNIQGGITIGTAAFGPGISGSVTSSWNLWVSDELYTYRS
jgi:hypothetical protein